jgi:hypothetical protein
MLTCATGHRKSKKAVQEDDNANKEMDRKSKVKKAKFFCVPTMKAYMGSSGIAPLILNLSN